MMQLLKFPFSHSSKTKGVNQAKSSAVSPKPQDASISTTVNGEDGEDFAEESMEWEIEVSKDEIERKEKEMRNLNEKILEMEKSMAESETQLNLSRQENQILNNQLQSLVRKMEQLTVRHKHTVDLLGARTPDPVSRPTFSWAVSLSEDEVVPMVEALNTDMLQAAAFISDSFVFEKRAERDEEELDVREAYKRASELLGNRMVQLLKSTPHEDDPLLLEIAIMSSLASCCRWITKAWFINNLLYGRFLDEMYGGARDAGDQTALDSGGTTTNQQVGNFGYGRSEEHLVLAIADILVSVLMTAGWKGSFRQVRLTVMTKFSSRLAEVAKSAIRLNKGVAEEVALSDLEVVYLDHGVKFDCARMDNTYGDTSKEGHRNGDREEDILCTSELGLRRAVRLEEYDESQDGWFETILLKPKVVLLSELEETTNLFGKVPGW